MTAVGHGMSWGLWVPAHVIKEGVMGLGPCYNVDVVQR